MIFDDAGLTQDAQGMMGLDYASGQLVEKRFMQLGSNKGFLG